MFSAMIWGNSLLSPSCAVRLAFLGLGLTSLTACNMPVTQRGNLPKADAMAQIKAGVTDKATVQRLLGTPSTKPVFDANTWYYISRETKEIAFLNPEILDQQVVAIHFDESGIVNGIDRKGLHDAQVITPNPNATPAQGREFTFLEQLLGNFGKFNNSKASTPGAPPGGGR
jgi:outer membrane protein assembly factor BamE (lipoprotein component of BamABCDE complex)